MTERSARVPKPGAAATTDTYHHGALRTGLLAAAETLLLERGAEGFTLRECARRAGVSHAAPAHHFRDARGLLTALAAVGLNRMADLMEAYRARAGADPVSQLVAIGQAYIDFAIGNRALFQMMFRIDRLDATDPDVLMAGNRARALLQDAMLEVMTERGLAAHTLPQRVLLAWAAVHGYATLVIEGQLESLFAIGRDNPGASSAAGAAMLALLQGALAGDYVGPSTTSRP